MAMNEDHAMSPDTHDLETTTWDVSVVDAEVKLYLLAFIRFGGHEAAQQLTGLDDHAARSARGWLKQVGIFHPDGTLNAELLRSARHGHLSVVAA
jgi:hypothetical protein